MNGTTATHRVMNAAAPQAGRSFAPRAEMTLSRVFGAYLQESRYESLRMLRSPAFAIPFLLLPAALYLLFGVVVYGAIKDPNTAIQIFTGFDVFGVMGPAMFGFGVVVALEREQSLLTLKRALPMPPAAYVVAKMLMAMTFGAIVTATMLAAAVFVAHLPLSAGQCAKVAVVNILGVLPFCAMGLFLGVRLKAKTAHAIVNIFYLAMIYLSDILIPLPKSIEAIALASPAFYLDQLVLGATGGPSHGAMIVHVAVLVGVTLLLGAFAVRRLARVG
jgi:ABC-2 type transport system permease protein